MRISRKLAAGAIAALMCVSMTACSAASSASAVSMNELVNASLAQSGSSCTVTEIDASSDAVAGLIEEAISAYSEYKNHLTNTASLRSSLTNATNSDGTYKYRKQEVNRKVKTAMNANLNNYNNFLQSVQSFKDRGIGAAYAITSEEVPAGVYDTQAVADYVASLLTGDARVYVSDVIEVPVLDDDEGSYSGYVVPIRYVYVEYVNQ